MLHSKATVRRIEAPHYPTMSASRTSIHSLSNSTMIVATAIHDIFDVNEKSSRSVESLEINLDLDVR